MLPTKRKRGGGETKVSRNKREKYKKKAIFVSNALCTCLQHTLPDITVETTQILVETEAWVPGLNPARGMFIWTNLYGCNLHPL